MCKGYYVKSKRVMSLTVEAIECYCSQPFLKLKELGSGALFVLSISFSFSQWCSILFVIKGKQIENNGRLKNFAERNGESAQKPTLKCNIECTSVVLPHRVAIGPHLFLLFFPLQVKGFTELEKNDPKCGGQLKFKKMKTLV